MMQGLNNERNFSVSLPCNSRYWTARPPRAASSSTVKIAAVPASSYHEKILPIFIDMLVNKKTCPVALKTKSIDELYEMLPDYYLYQSSNECHGGRSHFSTLWSVGNIMSWNKNLPEEK
jgi:hypothetical protein